MLGTVTEAILVVVSARDSKRDGNAVVPKVTGLQCCPNL